MSTTSDYEPVIDREMGELFLLNADDPLKTHVMSLVHDWWATAPQSTIEQYHQNLLSMPDAEAFLAERFLPEPITLEDLEPYAEGTLGHAYKSWIVDNNLMADLAQNQHKYFYRLVEDGRLDRMPEDVKYLMVRGFMLHDYLHTITGWGHDARGELGMAGFHHAQLRTTYHAFRVAVTTAHVGFVNPFFIDTAMDAMTEGWVMGKRWKNLHFTKWEEQLDRPLADIRDEYGNGTPAKPEFSVFS